jgi:hypothetical protein
VGTIPSILLAVVLVAALVAIQVRHVRTVKRQRLAIMDAVLPLLADAHVEQDGIGFPTLTGRSDGDRVKVELVVDTLSMRQLPTLWLMVTLLRDVAIADPVDITLRPRQPDIVSPSAKLRYEHAPPPGWPIDSRITTATAAPPPFHALRDALPFLHDPHVKALLVAPGGVRIVQELARGDIGRHRVIRRARFDAVTLRPEHLDALLGVAREVARDVELAADLEALTSGTPPAR